MNDLIKEVTGQETALTAPTAPTEPSEPTAPTAPTEQAQTGTFDTFKDFFDIEQPVIKREPKTEPKSDLKAKFAAKVLFKLVNGAFNIFVLLRTGKQAKEINATVDDDEQDLFIEIITDSFSDGTFKTPPPLILFVLLILSMYVEPVATLIMYKPEQDESLKYKGTKVISSAKKTKGKQGRHKKTCGYYNGLDCDCK